MTLHFYWTHFETQKGPNYWYEQPLFVWCLLRQRNGGLNSGLKSVTIVIDAYLSLTYNLSDFATVYTKRPKSKMYGIMKINGTYYRQCNLHENILTNKEEMTSFNLKYRLNVHDATAHVHLYIVYCFHGLLLIVKAGYLFIHLFIY